MTVRSVVLPICYAYFTRDISIKILLYVIWGIVLVLNKTIFSVFCSHVKSLGRSTYVDFDMFQSIVSKLSIEICSVVVNMLHDVT